MNLVACIKIVINLLIICFLFSSCMVSLPIYSGVISNNKIKTEGEGQTHKEFMNSIKTKKDVVRAFGVASKKYVEEGIEIWLYEYGNVTQSTQRISAVDNLKVKTNTSSSVSGNNQYSEYSNRQTSSYTKYAEFQFDDGKNVSYWRSQGVNKSWNNHSEILNGMKYNVGFMFFLGTLIDSAIALTIAL